MGQLIKPPDAREPGKPPPWEPESGLKMILTASYQQEHQKSSTYVQKKEGHIQGSGDLDWQPHI